MRNEWLNEVLEETKELREKTLANAKNALVDAFAPKPKIKIYTPKPPMRVETFILAGTAQQAEYHFLKEIATKEYHYLSNPNQLRGLGSNTNTKIKIIKVGTWYDRAPEELQQIHNLLLLYDHEGILMSKSWIPDQDIIKKLDKLIHKAASWNNSLNFAHYHHEACKLRQIYLKYGHIEKRRANALFNKLKQLQKEQLILLQLLKIYDEIMKDTASPKKPSEGMYMDTEFKDTGMDSLDNIEFLLAVEEEFDIEIPNKDVEELETFGQAVRYIHEIRN